MKRVKIDLSGYPNRRDLHDGQGGVWKDGDVTDPLPDDIADAFVAGKFASFVDGESTIDAKAAHEERVALKEANDRKARADSAMRIHDALPKEVREAAHEGGDETIMDYLDGLPTEGVDVDETPPRRRRGRPPKDKQS